MHSSRTKRGRFSPSPGRRTSLLWAALLTTAASLTAQNLIYQQYPIPFPSATAYGIAAGADGNLWYGANGNMIRLTPSGQTTAFPVAGGTPFDVTAGPDGNVWFNMYSISNGIGRITPSGVATTFSTSTVASPGRVTAGPDGNVWFTYFCDNALYRITPSGTLTRFPVPTSGACESGSR
jgi:virginiamycin B lyase